MDVSCGEPDLLSRMVLGCSCTFCIGLALNVSELRICSSSVGDDGNMTAGISQSPESSVQSGHWAEGGTQT